MGIQEQSTNERLDAVDPAVRALITECVGEAVGRERRERRRKRLRNASAALAVMLLAATSLWASTALATGSNCATGLICFSAGDPAVADDVNQNFKTLKGWLDTLTGNVETKIGPLNTSSVETDEVVVREPNNPWGVTIGDQTADSIDGLNFHNNPAGGTGDNAWIRYERDGTGEDTALVIGVSNDPDDDMRFHQAGAARMSIAGGDVEVTTDLTVTGNVNIQGQLNAWPAGSYCILKNGACPSGFTDGRIQFDVDPDGGTEFRCEANTNNGFSHCFDSTDEVRLDFCCK